jgi:hypothetical protein
MIRNSSSAYIICVIRAICEKKKYSSLVILAKKKNLLTDKTDNPDLLMV